MRTQIYPEIGEAIRKHKDDPRVIEAYQYEGAAGAAAVIFGDMPADKAATPIQQMKRARYGE